MSALRGFGFEITAGGTARYWYAGKDGIQRWSDNDKPVTPEHAFIAAMSAGLPPIIAPLALQSNNSDIAVSESAYFPLTAEQLAEGDLTEQRR